MNNVRFNDEDNDVYRINSIHISPNVTNHLHMNQSIRKGREIEGGQMKRLSYLHNEMKDYQYLS